MWIKLNGEGTFFFGSGGVTVIRDIDLRDKAPTFIYKTELLSGTTRVGFAVETSEEITKMLNDLTFNKKGTKAKNGKKETAV